MKKKIKNAKIEDVEIIDKEKKKTEKKEIKKEENKNQEKIEKTNKVLDEIKAFLILALIIGIVVFGGWYWFTHIYNSDKPVNSYKEEKKVSGYKTIKYTASKEHNIDIINENLIIEFKDNVLYKIMDKRSDTLYEGEIEFDYVREGSDGNIYVIKNEEAENENVIHIYKLEDKKLKEDISLAEQNVYFSEILYEDKTSNSTFLVGFKGFKDVYDDEFKEIAETYIYKIDSDKMIKQTGFVLVGDYEDLGPNASDIITYDSRYIVIREFSSGVRTNNYGIYDIETNTILVKPQYEGLYTNGNDTYIALKNGKAGIITNKLKKIVNFEYDFIDRNEDYYVVSKNGKMAIMNSDYKLISKFDFDYQSSSEDLSYNYNARNKVYNTFTSRKVNDKYILTINNMEYQNNIEYPKHDTYIINSDGTYNVIQANEFFVDSESNMIYSFDKEKKIYTFYDQQLNEVVSVDISSYDYNGRAIVNLINGNTIRVWFDSFVYFDYETGEEIETLKDYSALVNGITIDYIDSKGEVSYSIDGDIVAKVNVKDVNDEMYFKTNGENILYYLTQKEYVYIEKGE